MPGPIKEAAREIVSDLLSRFPDTPTLTLAKKAYKSAPAAWSNQEACRCYIRRLRGNHGTIARNHPSVTFKRPNGKSGEMLFPSLPEPIEQLTDFKPYQIDTPGQWLIISDIHLPFYNRNAVEVALTEGKRRGVKGIIINGDLLDFYALSSFVRDPRLVDFPAELESCQAFLKTLRDEFPKAQIVFHEGNHEQRFSRYMTVKAPELLSIPEFQIESVLKLADFGIEYVKDMKPLRMGKGLWVVHGHEFGRTFAAPVNAARGLYLRAHVSAIQGDCHATSQHSEPNLDEHLVSCWSTGKLCGRPAYRPINKWNDGFAVIELSNHGEFGVSNFRIVKGRCFT